MYPLLKLIQRSSKPLGTKINANWIRHCSEQKPRYFIIPTKTLYYAIPFCGFILLYWVPAYTPREILDSERIERGLLPAKMSSLTREYSPFSNLIQLYNESKA